MIRFNPFFGGVRAGAMAVLMGSIAAPLSAQEAGSRPVVGDMPAAVLPVEGRRIALIFDDGPLPESTVMLLEALKAANMRATFSLVGKNVAAHPDLARRIAAEGHEIATRTWSNYGLTGLTEEQIRKDLLASKEIIREVTGITPRFFRPPRADLTEEVRLIAEEQGLQILIHSFDSGDWRNPPKGRVTRTILDGITPGALVVAHESFPKTVAEMPEIIAELSRRGFRSYTVTELRGLASPNRMVFSSSVWTGSSPGEADNLR